MEIYKKRLIAYSLGNFIGYKVFGLGGPLSTSMVLQVTLEPRRDLRAPGGSARPMLVGAGVPAPGRRARWACVQQLSRRGLRRARARASAPTAPSAPRLSGRTPEPERVADRGGAALDAHHEHRGPVARCGARGRRAPRGGRRGGRREPPTRRSRGRWRPGRGPGSRSAMPGQAPSGRPVMPSRPARRIS